MFVYKMASFVSNHTPSIILMELKPIFYNDSNIKNIIYNIKHIQILNNSL